MKFTFCLWQQVTANHTAKTVVETEILAIGVKFLNY